MFSGDEKKADTVSCIPSIVSDLRKTFQAKHTQSRAFRETQLDGLAKFLIECEDLIKKAVFEDLHKSSLETFAVEIGIVSREIRETRRNLASWMAPKKVSTFFAAQPATSYIQPEPLGVVLIIAPWNYPIQLLLMPLVGAIAAGNCAILKPSELAPKTSQLLAEYLPKYIDPECYRVIEGAIPETEALLSQKFDHIFFTGSGSVGKIVLAEAAKQLTSTTLELGGKCPCIVDDTANIPIAAKRIVWGKFSNAGQTCIAPDYLLVDKDVEETLLFCMKETLQAFYGKNPQESKDYGRIINSRHHQRLLNYLSKNGDIFIGGEVDEKDRYIAPTILRNVLPSAPIMEKDAEIFGPILPILTYKKMEEAIEFIKKRPKPLALYLFSEDSNNQQLVADISAGSFVLNHTLLQAGILTLPFGGVGESGMGAYHGKKTFDTFSHQKAIFKKPTTWNMLDISSYAIYPPGSSLKESLLRWFL